MKSIVRKDTGEDWLDRGREDKKVSNQQGGKPDGSGQSDRTLLACCGRKHKRLTDVGFNEPTR